MFDDKKPSSNGGLFCLVYGAVIGFNVDGGVFTFFYGNGGDVVFVIEEVGIEKAVFFDEEGVLAGRQFYFEGPFFIGLDLFDEFCMDGGIKGPFPGFFYLADIG